MPWRDDEINVLKNVLGNSWLRYSTIKLEVKYSDRLREKAYCNIIQLCRAFLWNYLSLWCAILITKGWKYTLYCLNDGLWWGWSIRYHRDDVILHTKRQSGVTSAVWFRPLVSLIYQNMHMLTKGMSYPVIYVIWIQKYWMWIGPKREFGHLNYYFCIKIKI